MHCIVTKTRQEKEMQEDWENSTIVPIYKSNGDIHGVVKIMQVFAYTEHSRESLHQHYKKNRTKQRAGEGHAGFRPERNTIDQLYTTRDKLEKAWTKTRNSS